MPEFSVNTEVLMNNAEKAVNAKKTLNTNSYELSKIRSRLWGFTMIPVRLYLINEASALRQKARRLGTLSKSLNEAAQIYIATEMRIQQTSGEFQNPAFTGREGYVGGKQHGPMYNPDEVIDIVRKYHPNWSTKKIKEKLKLLNQEGCGYVAMANTIYLRFKGRESEFERTFGFPMYDKNGNLNYNQLIADFYFSKDNPLVDSGTTSHEAGKLWESYCRDHGVAVDVRDNVKVTVENYHEYAKQGQVIISTRPLNLWKRETDGSYRLVDTRDGGHAMTVTGVTDDGRFIVSSWGETYYLNPDLSVYTHHCDIQLVVYE